MSTRETLMTVVSDVLERFAFMFIEADDEKDLTEYQGEFLHSSITFTGRVQGSVSVTAPVELCSEMAANVLGIDLSEAEPTAGEDAIKELVNIICGALTPALFSDKEVFDLTVPSLFRIDGSKWRELAADTENVRLWIDDKPLLITLMLVNEQPK